MDNVTAGSVFSSLKNMLIPYADNMQSVLDTPDHYCLNCGIEIKKGVPMFFAAVRIMKNYVSYHLMPVYCNPALLNNISPGLKMHMHGKSCFNFKKVDDQLFKELEQLTAKGIEYFKSNDWMQAYGIKKYP